MTRTPALSQALCVPKTKSERIDDEVRPRWRANLWRRIAEPDERPAHPFAKTDAFELKGQNSRAKLVAGWTGANEHGQKLDIGTVRPMRKAPCGISPAFGSGAECHFVNGGSAGPAFGSEDRGPQKDGF